MKRKSLVNILAAVAAALVSAVILYETLIAGSLLRENGLIGIFFAAMFSHLTVIGRGIFVPVFLPLTAIYHPLVLGVAAGLGGAIGETTTYIWGRGIRDAFENNEKEKAMPKWVEKYGIIALLIVAASPLPDTPLILLYGTAKLSLKKLLLIEAVGKTTLYSLGAVIGGFILGELGSFVQGLVLSTVIVVVSIALCVVVSWSKTRNKIFDVVKKIPVLNRVFGT